MDPATIMAMLSGQGGQGGQGLIGGGYLSDVGRIFGGLFGNSGAPYKDAMKEYERAYGMGKDIQNPFMQYGMNAMPQMNEWLAGQKDPSGFINKLMGQYSESPWAKFQQDQSARRFANAGSRGDLEAGGTGSTPLLQFQQQNMRDLSSQDMNQWLSHVLGINTQYGQGLGNQIGVGQNAANSLSNMTSQFGNNMAEAAYGRERAAQGDRNAIWGGLFG